MHFNRVRTFFLPAVVLGLMFVGGHAPAVEPTVTEVKSDMATLDALMAAGDYAKAVEVAETVVSDARPKARAPDYLAKSIVVIRALMRQGLAERRLGRLDDAEATYTEAHSIFKDGDFRRLVVLATRQAGKRIPPELVELELTWLDLLYVREAVVVERLAREATRHAGEPNPSPEREAELRATVAECIDQLKDLRKAAVESRESFVERFAAAGAVPATPSARSLSGQFRESMVDGLAMLEQARLPAPALPPATGQAGVASKPQPAGGDEQARLRAAAVDKLAAAAVALGDVVAAVTPKGGGLRPEIRADLAGLEAELLMARARARVELAESRAAREDVERVLELRREAFVLRKNPAPDAHPDLAEPLLLAADLRLADARRLLADGKVDGARPELEQAQRELARVAALAMGDQHPLRSRLTTLQQELAIHIKGLQESIPRADAVDLASRRMIEALEAVPPMPSGGDRR
jgi:tetratricopeptide (TPR) repeat protein